MGRERHMHFASNLQGRGEAPATSDARGDMHRTRPQLKCFHPGTYRGACMLSPPTVMTKSSRRFFAYASSLEP